jgi:hypothetical protein
MLIIQYATQSKKGGFLLEISVRFLVKDKKKCDSRHELSLSKELLCRLTAILQPFHSHSLTPQQTQHHITKLTLAY